MAPYFFVIAIVVVMVNVSVTLAACPFAQLSNLIESVDAAFNPHNHQAQPPPALRRRKLATTNGPPTNNPPPPNGQPTNGPPPPPPNGQPTNGPPPTSGPPPPPPNGQPTNGPPPPPQPNAQPTNNNSPNRPPTTSPTNIRAPVSIAPTQTTPKSVTPSVAPSRSPTSGSNPNAVPSTSPTSTTSTNSIPAVCSRTSTKPAKTAANICSAYRSVSTSFNNFVATSTAVTQADFYAKILRAAFHDAAEVDMTNAADFNGPDGCMSTLSDNAGLIEPTSLLLTSIEDIWQSTCNTISRADFWVMLTKLAIERADPTRTLAVPYYYGRNDAAACYYGATSRLPDATLTSSIQTVFVQRMQLTLDQTVALLGGHTLGHVHPQFSGYGKTTGLGDIQTNAWDATPNVFDNQYYQSLLVPWVNQHVNGDPTNNAPFTAADTKNLWIRNNANPNIMLNSDMGLAYGISQASNNLGVLGQTCSDGGNGCANPTSTARPTTLALVRAFANNNALFLSSFQSAFTAMVNVGYGINGTNTGKLGTLNLIDLSTC